jgi:hypothetical protein
VFVPYVRGSGCETRLSIFVSLLFTLTLAFSHIASLAYFFLII